MKPNKMSTLSTPVLSLESLRPAFRERLKSMYSGELQPGTNGPVKLDELTRISEPEGMWIYETCRRLKPKRTLEIGLAYGFSTIYILAAIDQTGAGHHTALDPFQDSWHGVGALQAKHLGMESSFQMLEEFSVAALARFATQKNRFELIYIDGNHRFDDVVVDFTLAAEVCPMGGNIILDDMWMPSVQATVSWIRSNRKDFREVSTPVDNIAHFERIDKDRRAWDHFMRFRTPDSATRQTSLSTRIARHVKPFLAKS
jgi:predicted O-methyltransferase YrrM